MVLYKSRACDSCNSTSSVEDTDSGTTTRTNADETMCSALGLRSGLCCKDGADKMSRRSEKVDDPDENVVGE